MIFLRITDSRDPIKLFLMHRGINSLVPYLQTLLDIRGGWCVKYTGRNKHNMRTLLHYITGRKTRPVFCTLCPEVNIRILELDKLLCHYHARILRRFPVPMPI